MEETKLAWAAGIIDGEGCIGVRWHKQKKSFSVIVSVTNTDPRMLTLLKSMFGGSIQFVRRSNPQPHWKPISIWYLTAAQAHTMLSLILPYLIVKRDQAKVALEFKALRRKRGGNLSLPKPENDKLLEQHAWLSRRLVELKHEIPAFTTEVNHA